MYLTDIPDDLLQYVFAFLSVESFARVRLVFHDCRWGAFHMKQKLNWMPFPVLDIACAVSGCQEKSARYVWFWDVDQSKYICIRQLPYCPAHTTFIYPDIFGAARSFCCITNKILEEHHVHF